MDNELLLMSKNEIPFIEAQLNIHQPTVNEIALIGEENFFIACRLLTFSKKYLSNPDKKGLENKSEFEILMSIMCSEEQMEYRNSVMMLLSLLFPTHTIKFTFNEIVLANDEGLARINKENYNIFKDIINSMFRLNDSSFEDGDYHPVDKRANRIANKLKKGREQVAKIKGKQISKIAILSRYLSILAVGEQKDMNMLLNYNFYQLKDEFDRFQLKEANDLYVAQKLSFGGGQDVEAPKNWMGDIH